MAITISKVENNQLGEPIEFDLKGLSTDTPKPTKINDFPVGVNSLFLELDKGDFYYFDGEEWAKVGGNGDTPSGDGYEITNPVLTINYSNNLGVTKESNKSFVDDDGYLTGEIFNIEVGDSVVDTIVFGGDDGDGGYMYAYYLDYGAQYIQSTSNLVNCTISDALVTITDPTQDASIYIVLG